MTHVRASVYLMSNDFWPLAALACVGWRRDHRRNQTVRECQHVRIVFSERRTGIQAGNSSFASVARRAGPV